MGLVPYTDSTDLVLNEGGEREEVEQIGEAAPDVRVPVLAQTLVVEPIHLRDLPRFVIPAEDRDAVPITQLQRDEESHGFDGVVPSIDVVAHEEVVRIG